MSTETDFIAAADATLDAVGAALDAALASSDADLDWSSRDGILEIECEGGGKVIVNRHVPNREIWVAARAGGYHFKSAGGTWRDTRSGEELALTLVRVLKEQCGVELRLPALPSM